MDNFIIITILFLIHCYFYLLNFQNGKEGLVIPIEGNRKYEGLVSKNQSVLYRTHVGYLNAKLTKESIDNGVELYWSTGYIKPLSIFDFNRKPVSSIGLTSSGASVMSPSGHYLLVKVGSSSNSLKSSKIKKMKNNHDDDNGDGTVSYRYCIDTSIQYSDSYVLNSGFSFMAIFISFLFSVIFFKFLNIYFSIVPIILLYLYFNYENRFL